MSSTPHACCSFYHPFVLARIGGVWRWHVDPLLDGMLMFARAAPPGSHLLSISGFAGPQVRDVGDSSAERSDPSHTHQSIPPGKRGRQRQDSGSTFPAGLAWLRAPSIAATGAITLGAQSFGAVTTTGRLTGNRQQIDVASINDTYVVKLPPASGAMLAPPATR